MNMKKIWHVALAALLTLSLAACGGPANNSSTPPSNASAPEAESTAAGTEASTDGTAAPAGDVVTLRLGHTQSTEHLVNATAENFAKLVSEKTNGAVKIDIYPSETLGSNTELAEACSRGDVDFYVSATGQYTKRYAPFTIVEAFYMFRDRDHLFAFYDSDTYQQLVDGLAETCNVHILAPIYYGARQMTTSNKPLNTASDMAGLKMRAANEPLPIAAFTALGAVPTPIAYNETYLALQQNTVDGQENPPASIAAMKFYEVQDYMSLTNHQFQMLSIFMSDASMSKVSEEQAAIIRECAEEAAAEHNTKAIKEEQGYIEEIGQHCELVEPDIGSFREMIAPMYDQFKDQWIDGMYEAIQEM